MSNKNVESYRKRQAKLNRLPKQFYVTALEHEQLKDKLKRIRKDKSCNKT